jgi:pimeloyl-ACP methyl ester carboxylesterase
LRIRFAPGRSRLLVVSLSGVGTDRHTEPPVEFFRLAGAGGENPVLFVTDQSRSWLNAPDMADQIVGTIEATARFVGAERIVLLGNSMGATMALHLATLTPVHRVIAFVPQVSVHPEDVPEETRWGYFRKHICDWTFRRIKQWPAQASVFVLHGGSDDELIHALRFPEPAENVAHFILPAADHNLARTLHRQGHLVEVVTDMMHGRRLPVRDAILGLGGMRRQKFSAAREAAGKVGALQWGHAV